MATYCDYSGNIPGSIEEINFYSSTLLTERNDYTKMKLLCYNGMAVL
jgi:hypothetical protein